VSDFLVDYQALARLGQQLANLRGEFSSGQSAIAPLLGTISNPDLKSALKDFTNNWSDERAKLDENLNKAAGFATSAAACYAKVDEALARQASGAR
jgi:hypothetical protein